MKKKIMTLVSKMMMKTKIALSNKMKSEKLKIKLCNQIINHTMQSVDKELSFPEFQDLLL